jgi:hypothetical protein
MKKFLFGLCFALGIASAFAQGSKVGNKPPISPVERPAKSNPDPGKNPNSGGEGETSGDGAAGRFEKSNTPSKSPSTYNNKGETLDKPKDQAGPTPAHGGGGGDLVIKPTKQ